MKVLIIGSGGREHCLAWKIAQSKSVKKIYCACGNGGTSVLAENVDIKPGDIGNLLKFAVEKKISLTVVGPEVPLVGGIVDKFQSKGLKIFGPTARLAALEGSKIFAKEAMRKFGVPTAGFEIFSNPGEAIKYIEKKGAPVVVKADGLAAGKGVVVAKTIKEAKDAVDLMMVKKEFGPAGEKIIIEECLQGEEVSILAISDGKTFKLLSPACDHKRLLDGDCGPNTGGMGAYSPAPGACDNFLEKVKKEVFNPLFSGLAGAGEPYRGVLYAGLMVDASGRINVLEFNCRFGDPETQAILPRLKNDLTEVLLAAVEGKLGTVELQWDKRFCLCVVLTAGNYPFGNDNGKEIKGLEEVSRLEDTIVFHAGTKRPGKEPVFFTNGGRVLNVCALGRNCLQAQGKVYTAAGLINFEGMHYRKDIGNKITSC